MHTRAGSARSVDPEIIFSDEPNSSLGSTAPENIGVLFGHKLVMFGPREVLLTSGEPAVRQLVNGRRTDPIEMRSKRRGDHGPERRRFAQTCTCCPRAPRKRYSTG